MEDDCLFGYDLIDLLSDEVESESTDDSIESESTEEDCPFTAMVSCAVVGKKRKSRSRYDAPKVFKYDARWSYSEMLNLVLNGCDPYIAYSFFKSFARPDMGHTNRRLPALPEDKPKYRGIANFVKGWYITTITAPDATFCTSNPVVKNRPDGTSVVSCNFVIKKTDVYACPSIANENFEDMVISEDRLENAEEEMVNMWNHTRKKARSLAGLKTKTRSLQQNRVRMSKYPSQLCNNEFNFLDHLESVSDTLTLSSNVSDTQTIKGVFVMNLDQNKRIVCCEYLLNAL